jgi:hypothetical protein
MQRIRSRLGGETGIGLEKNIMAKELSLVCYTKLQSVMKTLLPSSIFFDHLLGQLMEYRRRKTLFLGHVVVCLTLPKRAAANSGRTWLPTGIFIYNSHCMSNIPKIMGYAKLWL